MATSDVRKDLTDYGGKDHGQEEGKIPCKVSFMKGNCLPCRGGHVRVFDVFPSICKDEEYAISTVFLQEIKFLNVAHSKRVISVPFSLPFHTFLFLVCLPQQDLLSKKCIYKPSL